MRTNAIVFIIFSLLFFTAIQVYAQAARPNIVLVIGDDMRNDTYGPTGGPAWFNCPNINRVADEGANFANYFCVYSLCIPSRSSIMTGLYPHSNGAYNNNSQYFSNLPTIATILHSAGYHTALIGKYHVYIAPQPGWDYWFAKQGETDYINPKFNYNGVLETLTGNTSTIIVDSSDRVLNDIDTPFLVCVEHQVAHKTIIPEPQYAGIYANDPMPIPPNYPRYTTNFPSFLYDRGYYTDTATLENDYEQYFEGTASIDRNLGDIFNILTERNILDNTMIIFTSDNGSLYGEHQLAGKGVAYDPSIRQQMFIRYPKWFAAGTVITSSLGIHTDIAPTILEAAKISATPYHFQGISLHKQAIGRTVRKIIMIENIKLSSDNTDADSTPTPSLRCVRDFNYKYIHYQCDQSTEEFFDLANDPGENNNLIKDPNYQALIQQYRVKLDSMRTALSDTLSIDTLQKFCFLSPTIKAANGFHHGGHVFHMKVSPNPFDDGFNADIDADESGTVLVQLYNNLGQLMMEETVSAFDGVANVNLNGKHLAPGVYYLRATTDGDSKSILVVKKDWAE